MTLQFKPDFILIPYQLVEDRHLEPTDRLVYGLIYWFEHLKDGQCTAGNATFAALLHTTTRAIQNSLTNLEDHGYIAREYKDSAKHHRTFIHAKVAFKIERTVGDTKKKSELTVTPERTSGDTTERTGGDQNKNIDKNRNKNKKNTARSAQDEKDIADIIEAFQDVNPTYRTLFNRSPQREAAWRLMQQFQKEPLLKMVAFLKQSNGRKYAPTITTPSQLESKMGELKAWADKERNGTGKGKGIISTVATEQYHGRQ